MSDNRSLIEQYETHIGRLIESLERVRKGLCTYMGPTCDCKYGFPSDIRPGTEQTGCPELRDAIGFLRNLERVTNGMTLLTSQEWTDVNAVMERFKSSDQGERRG